MRHISPKEQAELDATETREWLDSLDYVLQSGGPAKVARLLRELTIHARQNGVKLPFTANTPYINTIPADDQVLMPGSPDLERRIKSLVRWNAAASGSATNVRAKRRRRMVPLVTDPRYNVWLACNRNVGRPAVRLERRSSPMTIAERIPFP